MTDNKKVNRRDFMKASAATAGLFSIVPRHVLGGVGNTAPSGKVSVAGVGIGGMGGGNLKAVCDPERDASQNEHIAALCDVDFAKADDVFKRYPQAERFKDFREMLDKMGDKIDACIIATPDHTHAITALESMKKGKHVYVQKPLTHSVYEARVLTEAARKYGKEFGVKTQMGNQGHSGEGCRLVCEWIWDGAIGEVREVHAFTNRPVWPQALLRPTETPAVPDTLDWDLWLGPAPERPYHPAYHPWKWRAWKDFGTGALGDMACHILDPVFWALKLKYATSVQGSYAKVCTEMWKHLEHPESYPMASKIHLEYPAREGLPPVKVSWYDGGIMPEIPEALESGRRMGNSDGGVLFIGDNGVLMCGCYGAEPQLVPYSKMRAYKRPQPSIPRVSTSHEMNWIEAIKDGKKEATSNFEIAGPFTEMVLMGNLSLAFPNKKILWDGENMNVTNLPDANALVNPKARAGWELVV